MGKNVTVQVGDELAANMEKLSDVNWSEVVRGCLERYCNVRLNPNIEALIQKMKEQKEEAYSEGYKAALEWFKEEDVGYKDVNEIFQELSDLKAEYEERMQSFNEQLRDEFEGNWEAAVEDGIVEPPTWNEAAERNFWIKKIEVHSSEISPTDAFIEGFKAALEKLERMS